MVIKKEDLLGLLEELSTAGAAFFLDVSQSRRVVDPLEDGHATTRWRKDVRQEDP
jgi:hypothetical protein